MAERVYLISVVSHGITSGRSEAADDLIDACTKVRDLQKSGAEHISIILNALPQTMRDDYQETFDV